MYATIDDVKLVRGKETLSSFQEDRINFFLGSTKSIIDGVLGGDYIEQKQRTQRFDKCLLRCDSCSCSCLGLLFHGLNVQSIDEIDGTTYTGMLGTDYVIDEPNLRKVSFYDFPSSSLNDNFCTFEVTYTSGYDPIPDDIKYAQSLLVVAQLNKQDGRDLKSYKLRERTVTFTDDSAYQQFVSLLGPYMTITL